MFTREEWTNLLIPLLVVMFVKVEGIVVLLVAVLLDVMMKPTNHFVEASNHQL